MRLLKIAKVLVFGTSILPLFVYAQTNELACARHGYTIETINGVSTSDWDARKNNDALQSHLPAVFAGENLSVGYLYNPTNGILDYTDVAIQKLSESVDMNDPDFIKVLSDASTQVKTQKLLLVPHSQGNFYANNLYKVVTDDSDVSRNSIGVYGVATPASYVAGDGKYLTSSTDTVIEKARIALPGTILQANDTISYKPSDDEGRGHGFKEVYLQYRSNEIANGIKQSLDKLSVDLTRREDVPCIRTPEALDNNLSSKAKRTAIYTADTTIATGVIGGLGIKNSAIGAFGTVIPALYSTTMFASDMGQAFARSTIFAISLLARTAENLAISAVNSASSLARLATNSITGNNSASIILATDSPSEAPTETELDVSPTVGETRVSTTDNANLPAEPAVQPDQNANDSVSTTSSDQPEVASSEQAQITTPTDPTANASSTVPFAIDLGGGAAPATIVQQESAAVAVASSTPQLSEAATTTSYVNGVTPTEPINTTLSLATTTFSGTYNNSATFNTIVFELKNLTLDTASSSIARSISTTTGENISYSEDLVFESAGTWQYQVRLEDATNATSTPWSSIKSFKYEKAIVVDQPTTKTIYLQPLIGTPIDVGNSQQSSQVRFFSPPDLTEDAYILRIKKSSDFDCRNDFGYGYIGSGDSPFDRRVAEIDGNSATTDGQYCDYRFTWAGQSMAIKTGTPINKIVFWTAHRYDYLDGSASNDGWSANGFNQKTADGGYAFQLCNIVGCDRNFSIPVDNSGATTTPPSGGGSTPVLSSEHAITAFSIHVGTSTVPGIINEAAHTISIALPFGTDVRVLMPTVSVSVAATSSPVSGVAQDFMNPVTYIITAEDGSTQSYVATVTILPDTTPTTPTDIPDASLPTITSYTLNGTNADATIDYTTTQTVAIALTANKKVNWTSITVEDANDPTRYKRFFSGTGCVDGTTTCTKIWGGDLSHGSVGVNATYRIKVNMKDSLGNVFHDYVSPYQIILRN